MTWYAPHSWPRFASGEGITPAVRQPAPSDPWPRWGWFPRERRTWVFAPGPALTFHRPQAASFTPPSPETSPPTETEGETIEARPVVPRFVSGLVPSVPRASTALVPIRRELMLADAGRIARKAAPAAVAAGVVAVAALALFRRR